MSAPGIAVDIRQLPHGQGLALPAYQTPASAGMDLTAALGPDQAARIAPGGRALIPTGISIALPAGFEAQIRPRSGLADEFGVTVLNGPGTIDADYRGEVKVLLVNHGTAEFEVRRGMRVAQLVVAPVAAVSWRPVAALEDTARGGGGFGSTGRQTGSQAEKRESMADAEAV